MAGYFFKEAIEPYFKNGWILFAEGHRTLLLIFGVLSVFSVVEMSSIFTTFSMLQILSIFDLEVDLLNPIMCRAFFGPRL